jgi:hypothetical protein
LFRSIDRDEGVVTPRRISPRISDARTVADRAIVGARKSCEVGIALDRRGQKAGWYGLSYPARKT